VLYQLSYYPIVAVVMLKSVRARAALKLVI